MRFTLASISCINISHHQFRTPAKCTIAQSITMCTMWNESQARERNPNPKFLVRMSSGGVGVFHVKGWGPKSSVCSSETQGNQLLSGISQVFFPRFYFSGCSGGGGQVRKNSLNIKFWAGYFWDIPDPDVGIPRTKTLCRWPFSVVLDREWPGCPGIWVGTSRTWKNLCKKTLG